MLLFKLVIECATPLHCGAAAADSLQDAPVARDAFGLWRIPGSSLAGALRALCKNVYPELVNAMFGFEEGEARAPSLVWVQDGLLLDYDGKPALKKKLAGEKIRLALASYIRDHVRINELTGAAADTGKFDAEIVPAGARFLLNFRLDGWDKDLPEATEAAFARLCSLILGGSLSLGGKSGNGYGQYRVIKADYQKLDLRSREDMEKWLNEEPFSMPAGDNPHLEPASLPVAATGLDGTIELPLVCQGPMLIGGGNPERPGGDISEADINFCLTPYLDYAKGKLEWAWTLPGSSIKGVLRHNIYNIMLDLGLPAAKAVRRLDALFGSIERGAAGGQCGRISAQDCELCRAGEESIVQHVAIDRFTGGALAGALFNEAPLWAQGKEALLRLRVNRLNDFEAALFLHCLLDLAEGGLSIGAGGARGNGRMRLPHWPDKPEQALARLKGDLAYNGEAALTGSHTLTRFNDLAKIWDKAILEERAA